MSQPAVYILGGAQTDFARNWSKENKHIVALIREAMVGALEATGVEPREVQTAHVGNFAAELYAKQGHLGAFVVDVDPAFSGMPTSRHEAACASGSIAILAASAEIEAGRYDLAAVVGVEQMKTVDPATGGDYLGTAAWYEREANGIEFPFPKLFGRLGDEYDKRYGLKDEHLAHIAAVNYSNARRRRSAPRRAARTKIEKLQQEFERRVGTYKSPNGITCREWAERVLLDVRHNEAAVNDANLCLLRTLLEQRHFAALQNQVEEIYLRLVAEAFDAGRADPLLAPEKKRFPRDRFEALLRKIAEIYLRHPLPSGGKLLQRKLEDAGLPPDTIQQAQEQRRAYRHRSLATKYQETRNQLSVEEEVSAILHSLKSKLDTGQLPDDGPLFHAECLQALEKFQRSIPLQKRPALADLQGAMYVSADRCFHRYRRVKV